MSWGDDVLKIAMANPDVSVPDLPVGRQATKPSRSLVHILPVLPVGRLVGGQVLPEGSKLELRFLQLWQALKGPALEREVRFHPTRRWKFDFALPAVMVAVEADGGTRSQGRHSRHEGYRDDAIKLNTAAMLGWTVFRLTSDMITADSLQEIINFAKTKEPK